MAHRNNVKSIRDGEAVLKTETGALVSGEIRTVSFLIFRVLGFLLGCAFRLCLLLHRLYIIP